jgi:hypothetical protein
VALYQELGKSEGNVFFSPHSVSTSLAITYAGHDASMIALLPRESVSLGEVESGLTAESIGLWLMATTYTGVRVLLPRFKFECSYGLRRTLAAVGMKDAFDRGRAGFSGMDGRRPNLFISAIHHKGFVRDKAGPDGVPRRPVRANPTRRLCLGCGACCVFSVYPARAFSMWWAAFSSRLRARSMMTLICFRTPGSASLFAPSSVRAGPPVKPQTFHMRSCSAS